MVGPAIQLVAHGFGSRRDLPIPFTYAVIGAAIALIASFAVLGVAWRTSRLRGEESGRALPAIVTRVIDSAGLQWTVRIFGLVALGYLAMCVFFAPDLATNPAAGITYVVFWLGIIPASLLLGPIWRLLNPVRTLHLLLSRALGQSPEQGLVPLPAWLGYWPGAISLLSFGWLELVEPDRATTPVIRTYLGLYLAVHFLASIVYGSRWLDRGDGFEAFSSLLGRLSPFGRRPDGRVVVRSPLANLDGLLPAPGLPAMVCVMLGTTAYDSLSNSPWWSRTLQSSPLGPTTAGSLGLLACVAIVFSAYGLATLLTGRAAHAAVSSRGALPGLFAHSIVPIALGYLVAHYTTLLVIEGQRTLIYMSDPFSNGSDWFGTAGRGVDQTIALHPSVISTIQVLAVILGHVVGVVSAHDRAVRLFPRHRAVAGQIPLMTLMVGYTVAGLYLLFSA